MKNTNHTLSELTRQYANVLKKCLFANLMILSIALIATPVNAAIKNKENKTTVLTAVAANTEYNFSGNVKTNNIVLDNTILNIAEGKTLTLNNDLSVNGTNSAINASNIDLKSNSLVVSDNSKLNLSGNIKGGSIDLGKSGILGVENGKTLNLNEMTISSGTVDLAGTIVGTLKDATLNLTNKDADFSSLTYKDINLKISAADYDVNSNIQSFLNDSEIMGLDLDKAATLKVDAGTTLDLGQKSLSGGTVDLAGEIKGNLQNVTLNLIDKNAAFDNTTLTNVMTRVSSEDYNVDTIKDVQGITHVAFAVENYNENNMKALSQKFSNMDTLSFEKGTYNISPNNNGYNSIYFNNKTLNLAGGTFAINSLVGLVSNGTGDINISGGKIIGENSWNTPEEIEADNTWMGNNIRHDGTGDINITGGEVNFKDHASIVAKNGDINIRGGKVVLTNGAEIWSANKNAKTTIADDADITITSGADITPEGTLEIKGGKINATNAEIAGITAFNMTGGTLNLNNSMFGAEGPEVEQGNDSIHEDGIVSISGGIINIAGTPIIQKQGTITDDDQVNVLSGGNITMNGGVMNIQDGAFLSVRNGFEDEDYGELSTIKFTGGIINLDGTIEGNLLGSTSLESGLLNINDSSSRILGNVYNINLAINSDFSSDNINGEMNNLGNITLAEGKTLDLTLNSKLTGNEEDLNIKSFTMNRNSVLNITTSDLTEDSDRDFKATGPVYVTGTVGINNAGLKLDVEDGVANFDVVDTNATISTGDGFVARSNGGNMSIKNSNVNIESAMIEKVYNGDLNITNGSVITLSSKDGLGAVISKADTNGNHSDFIPEEATGDINIKDSTINMNAYSAIVRGDSEIDVVDDQLVFDKSVYAKGNGSININNSTINMNDHSLIAMNNLDVTQGTINITNDSVLNINGDNKILTYSVIGVRDSIININQDSTLSLKEYGTIHLGNDSVINLYGTFNGNLIGNQRGSDKAGTLNFMSEDANIEGNAYWLNIGIQANRTATGEYHLIHNLTVGNDEQKEVQYTIDGDKQERFNADINSMTIKAGSTVLAKTTTAEWDAAGELDSPTKHGVGLSIPEIQVDQGATLELNGNGNHSVDIYDVKNATIQGNLILKNGRLEGHMSGDENEDPDSTITLDGANVCMEGFSNIESGGAITIKDSKVDMDTNDHGILSSTSLDVQGSSISFSKKNMDEYDGGYLIAFKGFEQASGSLNIQDGSVIDMTGTNLLSGENINITDSEINVQGNAYIASHQDQIEVDNSTLTIGKGNALSVLTGKDLSEIDDEGYSTILEAYQALNPNKGTLNIQNNSVLNLIGILNSNINAMGSTISVNSKNASIFGTTTLSNSSVLNLGTNKLTTDIIDIKDGSTVNFTVASANEYGSIHANKASISSKDTTLNLTINNGVVNYDDLTGITVKVINADNYDGSFGTLNEVNNRYGFKDLGNGDYQIYGLGNSAASLVASVGGTTETQKAATAWLDTQNSDTNSVVVNYLENLAQVNPTGLSKAIETLQPETASVRVETTTSNNIQIANATTTRLNNLAVAETIGRAAGDTSLKSNMWVQGLHNKSKLDTTNGFSGKTYGIAMGFDTKPSDDTIVGIGYAYTQTDLDAIQKDTDIESHTAMLYGQKKIDNAFINAIMTYGFNQYDESKTDSGMNVSADYDMDSLFTQVMTGYNFNLGSLEITPKTGLRYLWTHVHDYTDSMDQHVQSKNTNTFTGVIGTTFSSEFTVKGISFMPKLTLAGTYDLKQDSGSSTVTLANGANYITHGDTLKRFGIESGVGLNMSYKNLEFGIQYEGRFKKDYKDHTGLINFRYNF